MARLRAITIVEDRTRDSRCDVGFLTVRRLTIRNDYEDGTSSDDYACDVVTRRGTDAVVAVLYEVDERRGVRVLLRRGIRAPAYLRRHNTYVHPDPRIYVALDELVAGIIEPSDGPGDRGLCRRARAEAEEEAGLTLPVEAFRVLGDETFASPGTSDEKLFFCAAPAALDDAGEAEGDGSVMEEGAELYVMELCDAIEACRTGKIPDMKTEVGLLRLADQIGYVPQLAAFVDELPQAVAARYRRLGIAPAGRRS